MGEQSLSLRLGKAQFPRETILKMGTCPLCSFGGSIHQDMGKLSSDPRRHLGMGKQHIARITLPLPAVSPSRRFSSGTARLQPPSRSSTARACRLSPTTLVSVPHPQPTQATLWGSSTRKRVSGVSLGSSAAAWILFGEVGCAEAASQPSAGAAAASLLGDSGGR